MRSGDEAKTTGSVPAKTENDDVPEALRPEEMIPFCSWVPTKDETAAYEKVQSYRRGWLDGTAGRPEDRKFIDHPTRRDLSGEYRRGYHDGWDARTRAMSKACRRLKFNAEKAVLR